MHAKGAGAHGYFEVTTDVGAKYSMAKVFSKIGKRTSVTARLSTIAGNLGNPDAVRDLRGLGFKYVQLFRLRWLLPYPQFRVEFVPKMEFWTG